MPRHMRTELWIVCGPPAVVNDKIQSDPDAGGPTPVLPFVSPHLNNRLQCRIDGVLPALEQDEQDWYALPDNQRK